MNNTLLHQIKRKIFTPVMVGMLGTFVVFSAPSHAATPSDVAQFFSQLQTYSARFQQTVQQDGQLVQQSDGRVWLKKPLKFRWNYQTPEAMQLVSDGKQFYHYDIELAQVTTKPIDDVAESALATLLNDTQRLDDVFHVKRLKASSLKRRFPQVAGDWLAVADVFYELTPQQSKQSKQSKRHADDSDVMQEKATQVILGLDTSKGSGSRQLRLFYSQDAYGENTFIFNQVEQNHDIDDSRFDFKAPAGVDVLGRISGGLSGDDLRYALKHTLRRALRYPLGNKLWVADGTHAG